MLNENVLEAFLFERFICTYFPELLEVNPTISGNECLKRLEQAFTDASKLLNHTEESLHSVSAIPEWIADAEKLISELILKGV